jgi:hypothetical protein
MLHDLTSHIGVSLSSAQRFWWRPVRLSSALRDQRAADKVLRRASLAQDRARTQRMRDDLYQLLEKHPSSRQIMRSLATVERTLHCEGLEALQTLPMGVVSKALQELERVVLDWSPLGLAELRSRLAVLLKAVAPRGAPATPEDDWLALDASAQADVSEVDHAVFEEMERSWVGVTPQRA